MIIGVGGFGVYLYSLASSRCLKIIGVFSRLSNWWESAWVYSSVGFPNMEDLFPRLNYLLAFPHRSHSDDLCTINSFVWHDRSLLAFGKSAYPYLCPLGFLVVLCTLNIYVMHDQLLRSLFYSNLLSLYPSWSMDHGDRCTLNPVVSHDQPWPFSIKGTTKLASALLRWRSNLSDLCTLNPVVSHDRLWSYSFIGKLFASNLFL